MSPPLHGEFHAPSSSCPSMARLTASFRFSIPPPEQTAPTHWTLPSLLLPSPPAAILNAPCTPHSVLIAAFSLSSCRVSLVRRPLSLYNRNRIANIITSTPAIWSSISTGAFPSMVAVVAAKGVGGSNDVVVVGSLSLPTLLVVLRVALPHPPSPLPPPPSPQVDCQVPPSYTSMPAPTP
jgi:hypothetical protein